MKPIVFAGDSLGRIRAFPADARRETGYQLERVQSGLDPADWKPMAAVGIGVSEIRVRSEGAFRTLYVAKFPEAVYVLHAFRKKTQQTSRSDIELARLRYRALTAE